ncbi:MAG: folylpolyglutamate synthase/dihydrofolate synthase family protein [Bacteroidota bacterium]|nr:folylpolyglutamate synthase/dihydrofolate synthase family protein [Bacteroidota bacterium]
MSEIGNTLKFLYKLELFGIKVGLQNIRALLQYLGNPENNFPSVHIAGTNGKGSTASMIASILTASGYRTGLYTSPHLVNFTERIRIDGKKIPENILVGYTKILHSKIVEYKATFFEATTAIAFQYFSDQQVDIAVIETGLGGRWDATNVISPLASIITNIGLEHTEYLGKTYSSIAFEKGGIIKPYTPCLTGTNNKEALQQLKNIAHLNSSFIKHVDEQSRIVAVKETINGQTIHLQTENNEYRNLFLPLVGDHQKNNFQLAILTVEHLKEYEGYSNITKRNITDGLANVARYSGIRGRFDIVCNDPLMIADVAHNPDGIQTLVSNLKRFIGGKNIIVFGVMKDKEYKRMIQSLSLGIRLAIAVTPKTNRALESRIILNEFNRNSIKSVNIESVGKGIQYARNEVRHNEAIILTGSNYLVGEGFKFLELIP